MAKNAKATVIPKLSFANGGHDWDGAEKKLTNEELQKEYTLRVTCLNNMSGSMYSEILSDELRKLLYEVKSRKMVLKEEEANG